MSLWRFLACGVLCRPVNLPGAELSFRRFLACGVSCRPVNLPGAELSFTLGVSWRVVSSVDR